MTDIFRRTYTPLTEGQKESVDALKAKAEAVIDELAKWGASAETTLAQRRLEEAVMWGVKHITAEKNSRS